MTAGQDTSPARVAFEAWASENGAWPKAIERSGDSYRLMQTAAQWVAWQAAWAALPRDLHRNVDAARYRYLRDRDLDTIQAGGLFVGMTPDNVVINGDDLDAVVDEAMAPPCNFPACQFTGCRQDCKP